MIATSAEVEAHDLRVLIDDQRIIIKPVHRIALREALAAAFGVKLATTEEPRSMSSGVPRLEGHVLVVEDEPVNAAVAEGYLQALGCTSVWATSGTDAAARRVAERFDLVLMDLSMPDMDGFTVTRLIRQHEGQGIRIPVIALTAHDAVKICGQRWPFATSSHRVPRTWVHWHTARKSADWSSPVSPAILPRRRL